MKKEEKCCGGCCWFYGEDTDGWGFCAKKKDRGEMLDIMNCSDMCEDDFVSREKVRHYQAVLLQHNRWRRSDEVPNHCRMVSPTDLGRALDFVNEYMKVFSNL